MPDEDQDAQKREGKSQSIIDPGRGGWADLKIKREDRFVPRRVEPRLNPPGPGLMEFDPGAEHARVRALIESSLRMDHRMMTVPIAHMSAFGWAEGEADFEEPDVARGAWVERGVSGGAHCQIYQFGMCPTGPSGLEAGGWVSRCRSSP